MLEWARHGARELDWIVAAEQLGGRGRQGREWSSPAGNLYASTVIRLRDGDPPAPTLAIAAACAVHSVVSNLTWDFDRIRIKWPNDILFDGAKIAGILLEREQNYVVVGVGLNLVSSPQIPGRPTTNVFAHGRHWTPDQVVPVMQDRFAIFCRRWRSNENGGLSHIRKQWLSVAHPVGAPLSAALPDGTRIEGTFDGLTDDCALILRLADGSTRVIHAGDVFLI